MREQARDLDQQPGTAEQYLAAMELAVCEDEEEQFLNLENASFVNTSMLQPHPIVVMGPVVRRHPC